MERVPVQAEVTVKANQRIAEDIYEIELAPHLGVSGATPGQFVNVSVSASLDPLLRRPFSICRLHKNGDWSIVYRVQGRGTELLSHVRQGETLDVFGPLGRGFTSKAKTGDSILLVGGGVGVPPLVFLAEHLISVGVKPQPVLGFQHKSGAICLDKFSALGLRPVVATDDGSLGHHGLVTDLLQSMNGSAVFSCGPTPMLAAVARWSREQAIPCQVSLEGRMACGVGACLGCVCQGVSSGIAIPTWQRVCKEGPVFDAAEVFSDAN